MLKFQIGKNSGKISNVFLWFWKLKIKFNMVATLAETEIHSNWFAVRWTRYEVKNVWLLLSVDRVVVFTLNRQKWHSRAVSFADKAEIIFGGFGQCARSKSNKFIRDSRRSPQIILWNALLADNCILHMEFRISLKSPIELHWIAEYNEFSLNSF